MIHRALSRWCFAALRFFARRRPQLFPKKKLKTDAMLPRAKKEAVWKAWQRFLDYMLALDTPRSYYGQFWRLRGTRRSAALRVRYAAFLAQYHYAVEFIYRTEMDSRLDGILNERVPELGLPGDTYAQLKYRYLHLGRAAEFGAMEALYKTAGPAEAFLPPTRKLRCNPC